MKMKTPIITTCLALVISACTDEISPEIEKKLEAKQEKPYSAINRSEADKGESPNGKSTSTLSKSNNCIVFFCEDMGGVLSGTNLNYWGYWTFDTSDRELFRYYSGFTEFQAEPYENRLGYLEEDKDFWIDIIDSPIQSIFMHNNVDQFQLESDRIAVRVGGALLVKEGDTWDSWVTVASSGVSDFVLEGDRIAIIQNGTLKIKEGGLSSGWVTFENNVQGVDLSDNRIVWLTNGGSLKGKDGSLYAATSTLYANVSAFQIDGDSIGQISSGHL
jgi:hypothetical protein